MNKEAPKKRIGWVVFTLLAVSTGVEFMISTFLTGTLLYLTLAAIVKAALIIYYFMHLAQLWRHEEEQ